LGVALISAKGWSVPEVEHVYSRARELCQRIGENKQIFWALMGLWVFYLIRADLRAASSLGTQILMLARNLYESMLLIPGHYAQAWSLFALGKSRSAQEHWEQVIVRYRPQDHHAYAKLYSVDFGVGARICASLALWCLGYPDQAVRIIQDACTIAQQVTHSFSFAFALEVAAMVHQLRYERQGAKEQAETAVTLSSTQGFPVELAMASIPRSWALITEKQGKEEVAQMERDLVALHALGAEIWRPYFLALLAEGYGRSERIEEGLGVLAEALATVERTEERWYEAELYRLKGTLMLQSKVQSLRSKAEEEAEEYFLKAIDIARRQQAKSLELRAATSLARLWQQRGKRAEAHNLLSEVYNWFTEGFDTKDLQEAKMLLEELHHWIVR
jgi:predicted ATPase